MSEIRITVEIDGKRYSQFYSKAERIPASGFGSVVERLIENNRGHDSAAMSLVYHDEDELDVPAISFTANSWLDEIIDLWKNLPIGAKLVNPSADEAKVTHIVSTDGLGKHLAERYVAGDFTTDEEFFAEVVFLRDIYNVNAFSLDQDIVDALKVLGFSGEHSYELISSFQDYDYANGWKA